MSQKQNNIVFITGACGFVGKFLVKKLLQQTDYEIILNCRKKESHQNLGSRCSYVSVDLIVEKDLRTFFQIHKPNKIIHLAAIARLGEGEQKPDDTFQTNILATKRLIKFASLNKVEKFLFVSSDLARPPVSVVGITKYLTEAAIQKTKNENMNLVSLRLPNVAYTPGTVHLIFEKQILEEKPLTITHPDMTRRFISGEEAANFILYALSNGKNKDIFVVNKKPEKIVSLAESMIKLSGKQLNIETIGMRAGEKLEEEMYEKDELTTTSLKNLSLLARKPFSTIEINKVKMSLTLKPGFTVLKELELL